MSVELRHLRHFKHLAEELNFTRAARRGNISQSSLSEQISRLEDVLGVRLVDRSPRHVRLTPAGETLARRVAELLDQVNEIVEETRLAGGRTRRRLRIGYSSAMALNSPMPRIVRSFRRAFPQTDTVLLEHSSTDFDKVLLDGEFDCLFIPNPPEHSRIAACPILHDPVLCCLSADHRLAGRAVIHLEDLREEPLILPEPGARFGAFVLSAFARADIEPRTVARTSHPSVVLTMVSTGVGTSFIPGSLAGMAPDHLHLRPLGSPVLKVPFSFVWDAGGSNPAVQDMVGIVRGMAPAQG